MSRRARNTSRRLSRAMDIFDTRGYKTNKLLMSFLGLWPYQPTRQRRIQCIFVHISITTVILVQGLKLAQFWGNIDRMVECIVPIGVQVVAMLKSCNCISNEDMMKRLTELIKRDWARVSNTKELNILTTYANKGRSLGFVYIGGVGGSAVLYLIIPLWPQILDIVVPQNETRPRQFLYHVEYRFIDAEDHYTFVMVHNYLGTILTMISIISIDIMLIAYVHHVCGMFTVIGSRLENTMRDADADDTSEEGSEKKDEEIHARVASCIEQHGEIIEFARLIEMSVSLSLLFQIGVSMLLISATGLHLVVKLGGEDQNEMFRLAQFILGQLCHLFFNSWPSQMLLNHSHRFRESIYFAEWYRFPEREKHLIKLVMLRSQHPCKISAGKLYDLSMESFGKVVQTSLSYFTVLVSLR